MSLKTYIYTLPLRRILLILLLGTILWCLCEERLKTKRSILFCYRGLMLMFSIAMICSCTLLDRNTPVVLDTIRLCPFYPIIFNEMYQEYFRTLYMNVLLFFPLGLALSFALPKQLDHKIGKVTVAGFFLSLCIEHLQYRFALGIFETDDLICNTFGTFLGGVVYLIYWRIRINE